MLSQSRQWSTTVSVDDDVTHPLYAAVDNLSDALYEVASLRLFAGLSLDNPPPDHTTIMNFRQLPERHSLARKIFREVSVLVKEGTLMDATIIEAKVWSSLSGSFSGCEWSSHMRQTPSLNVRALTSTASFQAPENSFLTLCLWQYIKVAHF